MKNTAKRSLAFMTAWEKRVFAVLVAGRSFAGTLDLFGMLIIGYLATSTAVFLSQGANNAGKRVVFAGLDVPAITATSLPYIAALILALFAGKAVISIALTRAIAIHLAKIEARASAAIASRVFQANLSTLQKRSADEVTYAIQIGSTAMFTGFMNNVATIVSEGFLFLLIIFGLFLVNPLATLAVIAYFGLLAFTIQVVVGRGLAKSSSVIAENTISTYGTIGDLYSTYRELFVAGKLGDYIERIYNSRLSATRSIGKQVYLLGMPRYIIETALIVGICAFGLSQLLAGNIVDSAATFGVILTGGMRIIAAMLPWQTALASLKQNVPLAESANAILADSVYAPELEREQAFVKGTHLGLPLNIEIDSASFEYSNASPPAIDNVTFSIQPGTQVALIGASGAGKSTAVDLIAGLIRPTRGTVLIDGVEATDYVVSNPGAIAYVPQKPGMLIGTLLENVSLGEDEPDLERATQAIKLANLEDVVAQLPNGLYTDVGKHRDSLSGGQLQRIGIARALYSKCRLLILDEATSGLDSHSESAISKSLESLSGSVTVVMVAHRLHTIRNADKVVFLKGGSVEAIGTFDELVKSNPHIAESVRLSQTSANQ